jgi:predicted NAD/FAD-dependent oxidoreductase
MSTRRSEPFEFDHGAQYFTVRDERFAREVVAWSRAGLVAPWPCRMVEVREGAEQVMRTETPYIAVPGMNALARHLAAELAVTTGTRVSALVRDGDAWRLVQDDDTVLGSFETVIVAIPPAQASGLLDGLSDLADQAARCWFVPCWAVLAGFEAPLTIPFDAARVSDSSLSWIARNCTKPGRAPAESWVLHASPEWSETHLEASDHAVQAALLTEFRHLVGVHGLEPVHIEAHRWRYAQATVPLDVGALVDGTSRIIVCGDWCVGARIESAYLSGLAAASSL